MGIRNLNKFFRDTCSNQSIKLISLKELKGKKIVIDASIYLYKFHEDGILIENIYLMISIFKIHNITPIFVFDGKSPTEKKKLMEKRQLTKINAQKEYNELAEFLKENNDISNEEKEEIENSMNSLKKKFMYIPKDVMDNVKKLISACGITYYEAQGESDVLCASLVIQKKVWACLSEDMDMFVYGATRVLRYLSLLNQQVILYDLDGILTELGISQTDLRQICVLSGTDYQMHINLLNIEKLDNNYNCSLYNVLKWYKKYHKQQKKNNINNNFYEFVFANKLIEDKIYDYTELMNIDNIFASSYHSTEKMVSSAYIYQNKHKDQTIIRQILEEDGFIYPISVST